MRKEYDILKKEQKECDDSYSDLCKRLQNELYWRWQYNGVDFGTRFFTGGDFGDFVKEKAKE